MRAMARHSYSGLAGSFRAFTEGSSVNGTSRATGRRSEHIGQHRRADEARPLRSLRSLLALSITTLLVAITLGSTADLADATAIR